MWSIGEIKEQGKLAFKANYFTCVIAAFILSLLVGGVAGVSRIVSKDSTSNYQQFIDGLTPDEMFALTVAMYGTFTVIAVIGLLLKIFLYNPLKVGCYSLFKENVSNPGKPDIGAVSEGFSNYGHIFVTLFLNDLFLVLWSMLFFIPGLIKSYSYRMVPYILLDQPELSATETITLSRQMMDGNKMQAFLLDLSFIGWIILSLLTCNLVGLFWTNPYMQSADAALYVKLRDNGQS